MKQPDGFATAEGRAELLRPAAAIMRRFLVTSGWPFTFFCTLILFSTLLMVATPYLLARLLDSVAENPVDQKIYLGFVAYSIMFGMSAALRRAQIFVEQSFESSINLITSVMFMERVVRKLPDFFIRTNPTEIQAAIQQSQIAVRTVLNLLVLAIFPGLLQMLLSCALLGAELDIYVGAIVLIYAIILISMTYFLNKKSRNALDRANASFQENAKQLGNTVLFIETLRFFNGQAWALTRYAEKAHEIRDAWKQWATQNTRFSVVFGLALTAQFIANYYVILPRLNAGLVSIGDVLLFNTLIIQLNTPLEVLGSAIGKMAQAYSSYKPAARMWLEPEEPAEQAAARSDTLRGCITRGTLRFENVAFSYTEGARKAAPLRDISFEARRGQLTFITGASGAGKSTLLKLALKAVEATHGRITIAGIDVGSLDRADWYASIGVVPQEVTLLSDSIADNILLGRSASEEELAKATRLASISEFIGELPDGYQTVVGERGLMLSGGERQRIAIARALLKEPAVLFLDEASSALDENTEREIVNELRQLANRMIIVAITHRKSVMLPGDLVVRLAHGRATVDMVTMN